MEHRPVLLPLISAFILVFASCTQKFNVSEGQVWATTYRVVYAGDADLSDSIKACTATVDSELSMFNPASALSAINAGSDAAVSEHFKIVFDCAKTVNKLSEGRYDPTVAPLVDLWGFGRKDNRGTIPSDSAISGALADVGISECAIDSNACLRRKSDSTEFDFSSIAKGYGVDLVASMLERNGVHGYMVEIGGEVRVKGLNPKNESWKIQIDAPVEGELAHQRHCVLAMGPEPEAVATSGNYRNFAADSTGRVYGHTISPQNGYPVQTEVLSATVLAPTCMLADAIATACMTGSVAQARRMLDEANCRGLLITADSTGTFQTVEIGELPASF